MRPHKRGCGARCPCYTAGMVAGPFAGREVGHHGTQDEGSIIYSHIFMTGRRCPKDIARVEEESRGHKDDCYCWACACQKLLDKEASDGAD